MRVVRPEWLVKSAEAGVLLPWRDFIFKPADRVEVQQGTKTAQRTLMSSVVSQPSKHASSHLWGENPPLPTSVDASTAHISTPTPAPEAGPSKPSRTPQKSKSSATSSGRPLHTTDPSTPEEAKRVPGYAADKSNIAAQRAMADPAWRAAHTSIAPDFIEGYYRNSREDAKRFLESRHGKNFWVFNFCPVKENSYDKEVFGGRVSRYPFPDHQ